MHDSLAALRKLGLEAGATHHQIKQAHRDLAAVWHPDRFEGNERLRKRAEQELKQINAARDFLLGGSSNYAEEREPDSPHEPPRTSQPPPPTDVPTEPSGDTTPPSPATNLTETQLATGAACLCLFAAFAPLYALVGNPPYSFFIFLELIEAAAAAAGAYALLRKGRIWIPLIIVLLFVGGIQLFGKMPREQWVPYDWVAVISFGLSGIILVPFRRKLLLGVGLTVLGYAYVGWGGTTGETASEGRSEALLARTVPATDQIDSEASDDEQSTTPPASSRDKDNEPNDSMLSLGRVAQAKAVVPVYAQPSENSSVYYNVQPEEYLVVRDYKKDPMWKQVLLQNMNFGFARSELMTPLNYEYKVPKSAITSVPHGKPQVPQVKAQTQNSGGHKEAQQELARSSEATAPATDTFTIGSSKDDVRRIQGTPASMNGDIWGYDFSSVDFLDDHVIGYSNISKNLKVSYRPAKPVAATSIALGSSRDEVLFVQGAPSAVHGDTFDYDYSSIEFSDDAVIGYSNISHNLRVQLNPLQRSTAKAFGIGSTLDEVLSVQGTPSAVRGNTWEYEYSSVEFENEVVGRYNNISHNLHLR